MKTPVRILIVCFVLLCTFGLQLWLAATPVTPVRSPLSEFPTDVSHWKMSSNQPLSDEILAVLKPDDYLQRAYRAPSGSEVGFFVAYYVSQHAGESMHSPKNCLPGSGWEPVQRSMLAMDHEVNGKPIDVNYFVIQNGASRAAVLYWYQEGGRVIANEYWGKAFLVWDAVRTGRHDGAIVRLTAPVTKDQDPEQAAETALAFAKQIRPILPKFLPK